MHAHAYTYGRVGTLYNHTGLIFFLFEFRAFCRSQKTKNIIKQNPEHHNNIRKWIERKMEKNENESKKKIKNKALTTTGDFSFKHIHMQYHLFHFHSIQFTRNTKWIGSSQHFALLCTKRDSFAFSFLFFLSFSLDEYVDRSFFCE